MAIFAPTDPTPDYLPTHDVTRMGDQNAEIGNDSLRLRTMPRLRRSDGHATAAARDLMAAPKGR